MSIAAPGLIVLAVFLLVASMAFFTLHDTWTTGTTSLKEASDRRTEREETLVSIASTSFTDCANFTVDVNNPGQTSVVDFSEMDFIVEYTGVGDTNELTRLTYTATGAAVNEWSLSTITPDTRHPNAWNPEEQATPSHRSRTILSFVVI